MGLLRSDVNFDRKFWHVYFLVLVLICMIEPLYASIYYVDSNDGNDVNAGLSPQQALRTLQSVNQKLFQPGDKILFKAGTCYAGRLKPQGSGSEGDPIIIDSYGQGPRPRIDGEGDVPEAMLLHNVEYWEVSNLEFTNLGEEREKNRNGIVISLRDFGTAHHIHLKNLLIHSVNGSLLKGRGEGHAIWWNCSGRDKKSCFDGLLIEGCHIKNCGRNGIKGGGLWSRRNWYPSKNVIIRNNLVEDVPGDGIVPIACEGAVVENNVMRDCPPLLPDGEAAAGIWPWSCDNTIIQFNEVSDHKAPWDGQGFDADYNCRNTVIQYNYSHDNEGGFLLICTPGDRDPNDNIGNIGTIIRYNVSVNDGFRRNPTREGIFSPSFHITGPCRDTQIYDNVIYVTRKPGDKIDNTLLKMDNWGGTWPENTFFRNNIFYAEDTVKYDFGEAKNTVFENNLYYGNHINHPNDPNAIFGDPLFLKPGSKGPGMQTVFDYQLRYGSPCIAAGRVVWEKGGRDFAGLPLPDDKLPCIGAFEYVSASKRNTR